MESYTIKKLADIAGVSVRTLHYYDEIGLLKPQYRQDNGYRYYGEEEVILLQQILLFRESGFNLDEIRTIISSPGFGVSEALEQHRNLLVKKEKRHEELINTVEKTMSKMSKKSEMEIKEFYQGFSDEKIEKYRDEVRQRWGSKTLEESEKKVIDMGREKFVALQAEGGKIFKAIMEHISEGYDSKYVQELIAEWRKWLENFHHYSDEEVVELGRAYSQHPDFIKFFQQYSDELPVFLTRAIEHYYMHRKPNR
ncbi:MAG: MerR family transcriptional regulator [Dehalococcoidales bacterium]|nr:MAG: MerR family transcriptional regulator [Dehalococcoidales bacterium]